MLPARASRRERGFLFARTSSLAASVPQSAEIARVCCSDGGSGGGRFVRETAHIAILTHKSRGAFRLARISPTGSLTDNLSRSTLTMPRIGGVARLSQDMESVTASGAELASA